MRHRISTFCGALHAMRHRKRDFCGAPLFMRHRIRVGPTFNQWAVVHLGLFCGAPWLVRHRNSSFCGAWRRMRHRKLNFCGALATVRHRIVQHFFTPRTPPLWIAFSVLHLVKENDKKFKK